MPYGTSRKRAARSFGASRTSAAKTIQAAARRRAFTKARGGLKSVSRIQRQPYAPRLIKNTASIAQLSRAVKTLQGRQLGDFQSNRERLGFQPDGYFTTAKPMCFCVSDFVQYTTDVGAPTWVTNLNDGANKHSNFVTQTRSYMIANTNEKNFYDFKQGDNTASKVLYAPISSTLNFEVHKGAMAPGDEPLVVRIDIVRQKKTLVTATRVLKLPESIGGLGNLCVENAGNRNRYNKQYFEVLQTKYLYLNNRTGSATTEIRKQCKIHVPLAKYGYLRPDADAEDNAGNYTDWYNNTDTSKQIWCVMSFSSQSALASVDINIHRENRWRDQHGTD